MVDIQRLHEEQLEAEYRFKLDQRFKPEVLETLKTIESRVERLEETGNQAAEALGEIRSILRDSANASLAAKQRDGDPPRWILYVIAALLAIIAFK